VIAVRKRAAAVIYDEAVKNPATPKGILVTVAFLALYCGLAPGQVAAPPPGV
jgi:hypothetical protein